MLDFPDRVSDVQIFRGNTTVVGGAWQTWHKPRGCRMVTIHLRGAGGGGGTGAVGAASTAAGGGGGGAGGQTTVTIPACLIPDVLYLSLAQGLYAAGISSYVSVAPNTTNILALANGGKVGGNASGATAGAAGAAATAAALNSMPLAGAGLSTLLAGQAGIIGGTTVAGGALTIPATGLYVTGGTGGGGLSAVSTAGKAGGAITGSGLIPTIPGGPGGDTTPTPGGNGSGGLEHAWSLLPFSTGGIGGGSSGLAASRGAAGGKGGDGAPGCGGGGGGGGFTGQTQATGGRGGDAKCWIICW